MRGSRFCLHLNDVNDNTCQSVAGQVTAKRIQPEAYADSVLPFDEEEAPPSSLIPHREPAGVQPGKMAPNERNDAMLTQTRTKSLRVPPSMPPLHLALISESRSHMRSFPSEGLAVNGSALGSGGGEACLLVGIKFIDSRQDAKINK
ncbi:hypothetical protein EYF80_017276 [Liparis tanakae]|uniref:Uncharacterized protein n=1 Tax=Liparis tanakae TaxID=230148 RepID=A0A4Z2I3V4_9TELE|nr:hypothetical protein EYF80_017276 [Liparis tanakae]